MKKIDISTWKRKEHYAFFSSFGEPYFSLVSEVEITKGYRFVKKEGLSFFAWYLHKSLIAVNRVEEFRYRIIGKDVVINDAVHASPTIGRPDGTFGFAFVLHNPDFVAFNQSLQTEIIDVQKTSGLRWTENAKRLDTIQYSSIPWNTFTGLTHPRNYAINDSVPKINFGKAFEREDKVFMNVAVWAHHGLMDGIHIAQYLEIFQRLMTH